VLELGVVHTERQAVLVLGTVIQDLDKTWIAVMRHELRRHFPRCVEVPAFVEPTGPLEVLDPIHTVATNATHA